MKTMEQLSHSIAVVLLFTWKMVENCEQGQFINQNGTCCKFCNDEYYVSKNCSINAERHAQSTECRRCSKCAEGWRMVSQCTKFSDAVCLKVSSPMRISNTTISPTAYSTASSTASSTTAIIHPMVNLHTLLYITVPLVLFFIIGIFACRKCLMNRYAQTKKTPYHLQQL